MHHRMDKVTLAIEVDGVGAVEGDLATEEVVEVEGITLRLSLLQLRLLDMRR